MAPPVQALFDTTPQRIRGRGLSMRYAGSLNSANKMVFRRFDY